MASVKGIQRYKGKLYKEQGGKCFYCGIRFFGFEKGIKKSSETALATIDHIIPRSKGGSNLRTNLVLACQRCNTKKGDSLPWGEPEVEN